jgi:hypothetical protein
MSLIEKDNGIVIDSETREIVGGTITYLITMYEFDDAEMQKFEEFMRGQGVALIGSSVVYFGCDIDRYFRMEREMR